MLDVIETNLFISGCAMNQLCQNVFCCEVVHDVLYPAISSTTGHLCKVPGDQVQS
jgi:hypothetical protein